MHQNIADCLLSSQSINQSSSQPKQPRRLSVSFFVKANTCYIKAVACPRGGAGWGSNSHFFLIRMVRPSTRMITVIFQGIRTRIAEKPYIFVIFWGRVASVSADVLWQRIFWRPSIFIVAPIVVGVLRLSLA